MRAGEDVSVAVDDGAGVGVLLDVGLEVWLGVRVAVFVGAGVLPGVDAARLESVCVGSWVTRAGGKVEGVGSSTATKGGTWGGVVAVITAGAAVISAATKSSTVSAPDAPTCPETLCTRGPLCPLITTLFRLVFVTRGRHRRPGCCRLKESSSLSA